MSDPFTADSVYELLHSHRPASGKPLPTKADKAYEFIASRLSILKLRHKRARQRPYQGQEKKRKKIAEAIETLADLLWETQGAYHQARLEQFDAFHGLVAAVEEAQRCNLPVAASDYVVPHFEKETVIMSMLTEYLKSKLPGLGVGERDRFVIATMKHITGNTSLTEDKVRGRRYKPVSR